MKFILKLTGALALAAVIASCSKEEDATSQSQGYSKAGVKPQPESIVIKASGEVITAVNEFRTLLGNLNAAPPVPGAPPLTGRREVNWDGVQAPNLNNANFPGNFFGSANPLDGNARKRGIVFSTPGTGLRVSDNDLLDIDPSYPAQFDAFSPSKIFIAEGSTITDVHFTIPGTLIPASVNAFGVIFSDVDNAASTSMLFFRGPDLLGEFKAPRKGADGFSFLGVSFPGEIVTRVRIVSGSEPVGKGITEPGRDLVVMDDFIYSEPRAL